MYMSVIPANQVRSVTTMVGLLTLTVGVQSTRHEREGFLCNASLSCTKDRRVLREARIAPHHQDDGRTIGSYF